MGRLVGSEIARESGVIDLTLAVGSFAGPLDCDEPEGDEGRA